MPVNKNAFVRYRVLNRCLCDKTKRYHIDDLIDACRKELARVNGVWGTKGAEGVSRRQVFNDLNNMEMIFEVNIAKVPDGRKTYYTYERGSKSVYDAWR